MKSLVKIDDLFFKPPGLGHVLFYPGLPGGGSTIFDKSPYGNNGSIVGATWVKSPLGLWCLSFDGTDDYVDCGNLPSIEDTIGNVFSLEVWCYMPTLPSVRSESGQIFSKRKQWNNNNIEFFCSQYTDSYGIILQDGTYSDSTSIAAFAGVWQHVVATVSSSSLYVYCNGVPSSPGARRVAVISNDMTLQIGRKAGSNSERWLGLIALPKAHRYALSPFEVRSHFEREKYLFGVW
ncbi:MAG TPA: LamG domain-containing protein [Dehalococcoidia bacterium]|nr:LamG domain-containing protein [Dehalococcoidia bacterium]